MFKGLCKRTHVIRVNVCHEISLQTTQCLQKAKAERLHRVR